MTTERFDYQRAAAQQALADNPIDGLILNVGCNDDPAHIKALDNNRVINCDLFATDDVLGRPNAADSLFDCARDPWPFSDREAALVILGDILEHLTEAEMKATLREARRVARRLCVTVPQDDRDTTSPEQAAKFPRGAVHQTVVTEGLLRRVLQETGWAISELRDVHYFFVPHGFFIIAE